MPSFYSSKNRDAQTLLPLIVKQIYGASHLVGRVCIKVGGITDITFVPNDDTGKIECNKWLHGDVETDEAEGASCSHTNHWRVCLPRIKGPTVF
ncbi:replication protein A 32 kDa subunit B-like isoform X2 [Glycine soja]|uniref:replication protein A 32 kDa subunit B-like isoform X2 n=1 Tax=Glycine soja TaxID=3848 RepID=UPI0007190E9B|nr:replication protein A 32 kDa subunit B-like isoform X2 [Glycine soja]XP_040871294.1 replication protein A 32 kDa subunit B-like isoform X2 [Glycine max]|eukprot:XP_014631064.1 replication protein A 32 kDa subunit B-like isoform X2 [Glycine max]